MGVYPATVVAIGGGVGAVVAAVLTLRWRQVSPPGDPATIRCRRASLDRLVRRRIRLILVSLLCSVAKPLFVCSYSKVRIVTSWFSVTSV